jgi:hypothetical protein
MLLNAADAVVTHYMVDSGLVEANLLLARLVGTPAFLPVKICGGALCVLLIWDVHRRHPRLATVITTILVACFTVLVMWNSFVLFVLG